MAEHQCRTPDPPTWWRDGEGEDEPWICPECSAVWWCEWDRCYCCHRLEEGGPRWWRQPPPRDDLPEGATIADAFPVTRVDRGGIRFDLDR